MKVRHATALALVGWYLMIPPGQPGKKQLTPDVNAPLSEWSIQSSFDTAAECTEAQQQLHKDISKSEDSATSTELLMATCIATDDPRLKGN
jgi:hypothetical protein